MIMSLISAISIIGGTLGFIYCMIMYIREDETKYAVLAIVCELISTKELILNKITNICGG